MFACVFLYHFSTFMVIPAITDVVMGVLRPSEESNTPIIKISVSTSLGQSRTNIAQIQKNKREGENKQFNEVQQLAYVLGTEGRRSYSTNIITRVIK